jgi:mono/diheme cytochrome c family protein
VKVSPLAPVAKRKSRAAAIPKLISLEFEYGGVRARILPRRRSAFLFLPVALLGLNLLKAAEVADQKWTAPLAQTERKNPNPSDPSSLAAGEKIYVKRCAACHGKSGGGDGYDAVDLGLHPAKFSNPALRSESDGELFWKISTGKKPMPGYGTRLSTADRWNVINYIRTLSKG